MVDPEEPARAVRAALAKQSDPVQLELTLARSAARKVLALLEAENDNGAIVVPVKEQFTTTEAAKLLGISRPTLMKMIDAGDIDSVKVATHHRIPAFAVRDFQRGQAASRHQAAKAITEFADETSPQFHNNVRFGDTADD